MNRTIYIYQISKTILYWCSKCIFLAMWIFILETLSVLAPMQWLTAYMLTVLRSPHAPPTQSVLSNYTIKQFSWFENVKLYHSISKLNDRVEKPTAYVPLMTRSVFVHLDSTPLALLWCLHTFLHQKGENTHIFWKDVNLTCKATFNVHNYTWMCNAFLDLP